MVACAWTDRRLEPHLQRGVRLTAPAARRRASRPIGSSSASSSRSKAASGFAGRPELSVIARCTNQVSELDQLGTSTAMLVRRVRPTSTLMSFGSPVMIVTAWL